MRPLRVGNGFPFSSAPAAPLPNPPVTERFAAVKAGGMGVGPKLADLGVARAPPESVLAKEGRRGGAPCEAFVEAVGLSAEGVRRQLPEVDPNAGEGGTPSWSR